MGLEAGKKAYTRDRHKYMPEKAGFRRKSSTKGSGKPQEKMCFCNCLFSVLATMLEAAACTALSGGSIGALAHRCKACSAGHLASLVYPKPKPSGFF